METDKKTIWTGRHYPLAAAALIAVTALAIYSNTLDVPFLIDDHTYRVENPKVRDLGNFLDTSGTRYVGFLTFALNYAAGGLDVFGYHLVNIAIHTVNGLLVWWLALLTFRTPAMGGIEGTGRSIETKYFVALAAALIFISHPIQTQAVTYITQRFTSLAALFYLLSLVLYVKWRFSPELKGRSAFYVLALISTVLAMKTKEISFTLPAMLCLYEFTFFGPSFNGHEHERRSRFLPLVPFLLAMAIIPLGIFGPEAGLGDGGEGGEGGHGAAEEMRRLQLRDFSSISSYAYLVTQMRVIITYLRLLVLPVSQHMDYDYPLNASIFEPEVFLSFLFLFFLFGSAVYLFLRSRITHHAHGLLISFGLLWFFLTLSVESSIIPIKDPLAEHRLYLPLVGLSLSFTAALSFASGAPGASGGVAGRPGGGRGAWAVILVIVAAFSFAAYTRNDVWGDEITFYTDEVRKAPGEPMVYNRLAGAYLRLGRTDEAMGLLRTALRLNPDSAKTHNNLGVAYADKGRLEEAVSEYKEALRLRPRAAGSAGIHNNLGLAYAAMGRPDEAAREYREALRLVPDHVGAHYNLALAYGRKGLGEEARREAEEVLRLRPGHEGALGLLRALSR
ncbi:MAG: tetratricopeptide repeat protein [Thermodesulfobacteriota bacterium]